MCHDWLRARESESEFESVEEWTLDAEMDEEREPEESEDTERELTEAPADD